MRFSPYILALLLGTASLSALEREVQMHAKKLDFDERNKKVRLIGDVKISADPYVMTAPYAEFFSQSKIAEFQGGVRLTGDGSTLTGNRMRVNYNDEKAVVSGNVRLVSNNGGHTTVMTGSELDYEWRRGNGVARGQVRVTQGDKRAVADKATYQRDRQMVYLEGNVRVERGGGDWITAQRARMNLATQTVEADGGVTARTKIQTEDKVEKPAPPKPEEAVPLEPPYPTAPPTVSPPPRLPGVDE